MRGKNLFIIDFLSFPVPRARSSDFFGHWQRKLFWAIFIDYRIFTKCVYKNCTSILLCMSIIV